MSEHKHEFVLAYFPEPRIMTLYESATAEIEPQYAYWTCVCGAVRDVLLKGEEDV